MGVFVLLERRPNLGRATQAQKDHGHANPSEHGEKPHKAGQGEPINKEGEDRDQRKDHANDSDPHAYSHQPIALHAYNPSV